MKLLFITPRFPYPPFRGDQAVPFHRMRILSRKHEITLLTLYKHDDELRGIETLSQYCSSIHTVKLPKWKSFRNMAFWGPISRLPLQVLYYRSSEFRECLNKLLTSRQFDLVHAFMLRLAPFCQDLSTPVVMDLIDSMQLNFIRRVDMARVPKKWVLEEELRRLKCFEKDMCNQFDRLIVVSNKDKEYIAAANVEVVPLGIDTERFAPGEVSVENPTIIFSGNMFYGPNVHAVKWFAENCFFRLQKRIPNISFIIAGNGPPPDIRELGNKPGITVTGFVESMPETLAKATLAVAPMQSGSGMQFKILEAMSCGLPVVTNKLGLGDIKAKDRVELLLAETADDFVARIVECFASAKYAQVIGARARNFVLHQHSWEHTTKMVENIYIQVMTKA
ncbi:glycosyltransferase family 4 protein [Geobacter argillaceus]|uniref:Sugar transferase (PEP-CTERM/EpsH1 system associated) n=1 Tax=Geobacter argillaceus TaxID=345631 RepID=A0A562W8T0_9BACT|nr:glycosyltransferase family 4 protein [Geobacter argillaceus]TWJ26357.1 sugar transferase (PEP-CTERM/EpsH1 system associated) [Geobacter argillaceus]